jgi:tetratricopeptide (TPR) repeat protein
MNLKTKACLFRPHISITQQKVIILSAFGCLAGILTLFGCAKPSTEELDQALALYRQNQLNEALPLFEQAVAKNQNNPEAQAWLAETYRRLGKREEAINMARRAIALDPCNSFAHTVLADAYNPMYSTWESANPDSTWAHLQKAVVCDSTDGNAWVSIWSEAIRRGELPMMKQALRSAIKSDFFTKAALFYCRWMLQHLPEQALLVTNGDMDTYPAVALQEVEGFRTDIAVVNRSLLNTTWYARFVRDHDGLTLPFRDSQLDSLSAFKDQQGNLITVADQIFKVWLRQKAGGGFSRPIAFSVTVDQSFTSAIKDHLQMAGPFMLWQPSPAEATPDTAMLRSNLASINSEDFAGPFVSAQDRSPVRQAYTKGIARNVTATALTYSGLLIKYGSFAEAQKWLNWAEEFEKKTEFGPSFTEQIASLKEAARQGLEHDRQQ